MGCKAVWEWEKERNINSCRGPRRHQDFFLIPLTPILQAMKKQGSEPNCQQNNIEHNDLSLTSTTSTTTSSNSSQSHSSRGSESSQKQSLPSTTRSLRSRSSSPFPDIPIDCLLHSSRDTSPSRTMHASRRTDSPVHMSSRSSISPSRSVLEETRLCRLIRTIRLVFPYWAFLDKVNPCLAIEISLRFQSERGLHSPRPVQTAIRLFSHTTGHNRSQRP